MDVSFIIVVLALVTMLAFIVFALVSKAKVMRRRDDPNSEKSTLAADKSSKGAPADV